MRRDVNARMGDVFYRYHPFVNLLYFVSVLGFSVTVRHPAFQLISLFCAELYALQTEGRKGLLFSIRYALPIVFLTALINPAFNHRGVTVLCYLPLGNPLTLESILYGLSAGIMLGGVLIWFSHVNRIFTTDKFVFLFGRILPALSLLISMTLRFIPRFKAQFKVTEAAQRGLWGDARNGSLLSRMKRSVRVFSAVVSWSLENAVESAVSMRSRGYGLPGRTAYSIFQLEERDRDALIYLLLNDLFLLFGTISGGNAFRFYPSIRAAALTPVNGMLILSFFALCFMPVFLNGKEAHKWSVIRSKG